MISRRALLAAPALMLPRKSFALGGLISGLASQTTLTINLVQGASVSGAPAEFWPACLSAAAYLGSLIYSNKTITITIGWGEVDGHTVTGLGATQVDPDLNWSYVQVYNALAARAKSANAIQALSTLSASTPPSGIGAPYLTTPQSINYGFVSPPGSPYAWCGFGSSANWSYSGTPGAGQFDFRATFLHEVTEALGRQCTSFISSYYTVPYFYCYSANNTRSLADSGRYFSINNGATNLRAFNAGGGGSDVGDWSGTGPSPFDTNGTSGQLVPLTSYDLTMIDVLGWSSVP